MPIRYNGEDNRLVYGSVLVKSVMVGNVCVYGDGDIGYSMLFIYSEKSDGTLSIDGLTEKGQQLSQIIIPEQINSKTVASISDGAFTNNVVIQSVTIPSGVTSIGNSAFSGCSYLSQINWNAVSVSDFPSNSNVFYDAGKAGSGITVTFGDGVEKIPAYLFYVGSYYIASHRPNIKSVTIGNGVTSIGDSAFMYCSGLTSITIPDSVTSIESSAFNSCSGLTSITVAKNNTKYHSVGNCIIETATKTLVVGCKTSVIPDDGSVTSIEGRAFYGCSGLVSITLPDSVTSIGSSAFRDCSGLTSVTIGNGVTIIGNYAFEDCSGLTSIIVEDGNPVYHSEENCLIKTATNTLILGCKTSIIPDSVTSIGDSAFLGCSGLTSMIIPDSVTRIGNSAFNSCSGLTSVTIGNGVTSIESSAFNSCSGLTSIIIPNSVTSINPYAFAYCTGLTSVTFENTSGWQVSSSQYFTSYTSLASNNLSNTSTAETYLTLTYRDYYWRRV